MNKLVFLVAALIPLLLIIPVNVFAITFSSRGVTLSENMTKAKEELKTLCALAPKFGQKLPSEAKIMNATYADIMNYLDICIIDITSGNYQGNTGPGPRS